MPVRAPIPCAGSGLSGSALANPYFGVAFLVLTMLLLVCVIVCSLALCLCCRHNKVKNR